MKLKLVIGVAALQVLVLAFMAGQREWIMHTGTPLTLRTAPIDPNDPMRGAYVRLNYDISTVPAALCQGETAQWLQIADYHYHRLRRLRDRVVYAALHVNEHGIAELTALREVPPVNGPFLRGRVVSVNSTSIQVRYGIEAFFMSKKEAVRTESMAIKERAGAPMAVSVAVGRNGTAVLQDYAWEPLGLTIALNRRGVDDTAATDQARERQPLRTLTATLHNYSDKDLAIVDLPNGRSFRLVPNLTTNREAYVWAPPPDMSSPMPEANQVIVLKPGDTHVIQIDLTQPTWWVRSTGSADVKPLPLSQIQQWSWTASFHLEYAPPTAEAVRSLPHADLIRHAPLRSRTFSPMQRVD